MFADTIVLKTCTIKKYMVAFTCMFVLAPSILLGQSPTYNLKQYNSNNGLPQNSVTSISFDRDGLLWLATQAGICSFDGQNLRYYNQYNTPVFRSSRFIAFYPREDGNLAVVDEFWDRYVISKEGIRSISKPLPGSTEERNPGIFVNGSIFFFDRISEKENMMRRDGEWIITDTHEAYAIIGKKLSIWNSKKNTIQELNFPDWGSTGFGPVIAVGDLLVYCKEKGVEVCSHGKLLKGFKFSATAEYVISNFAQGKGKRLNSPLVLLGKDIYKIGRHGDTLDASLIVRNIPTTILSDIRCSLYDSTKNSVFLGCNTSGFYLLSKREIFSVPVGVLDEIVSIGGGSFLGDNMRFNIYTKQWSTIRDSAEPKSLSKTRDGWVWGKVNGMLSKARPGLTSFSFAPVQKLKDIGGVFNDDKLSLMCLDTCIWRRGIDGKFDKMLKLPMNASLIFRYTKDLFWLTMHENVFVYDIAKNKLSPQPIFSAPAEIRNIFRASDGSIWLTTYGMGMYAWINNKLLSLPVDPSACLRYAHNIYEDQKGFFWIPTNNGLIQGKRNELEAYVRDSTIRPFFYRYGLEDGLVTNEFNGGRAAPYDSSNRGELVYPSMKGAIFFSPSVLVPDTGRLSFVIESVYINDKPVAQNLGKDIQIAPDFDKITMKIGYPYYGDFNNVSLEYNLEGLNGQWYNVGADRLVNLNRLPHGKYTLVIRKKNGFGVNNYTYKKLGFTVLPRFYETKWFVALLVLVLITISIVLYQLRVRSLIKQQKLLEKKVNERTTALSHSVEELNSTVGKLNSTVDKLNESEQKLSEANKVKEQTIAIILHDIKTPLQYLNLVAVDLKKDAGKIIAKDLDGFSPIFLETITQANAFVEDLLQWLLSQQEGFRPAYSHFSVGELYGDIEGLYEGVAKSRNNKLIVHGDASGTMLYSDRHMLKLIIRNLVDNANKHTRDGTIELLSGPDGGNVYLEVRDNGSGMTKEQLQRLNTTVSDNNLFKDSRLGLSLIGKFVGLINGTIIFDNNPNGGTTVMLRFKQVVHSSKKASLAISLANNNIDRLFYTDI